MRAITSLLIPGGTGCIVDPERVVAAVAALRGYLRAVDEPTWDERSLVALDVARTALEAALAAAGGGA
jgi:ATP-dependent protease HslVU (ClpYQ) peptidase subunit